MVKTEMYISTKDEKLLGKIKQQKNGFVVLKFGFKPKTKTDIEYVMKKLNLKKW